MREFGELLGSNGTNLELAMMKALLKTLVEIPKHIARGWSSRGHPWHICGGHWSLSGLRSDRGRYLFNKLDIADRTWMLGTSWRGDPVAGDYEKFG